MNSFAIIKYRVFKFVFSESGGTTKAGTKFELVLLSFIHASKINTTGTSVLFMELRKLE